jgi:hypothetical protein
VLHGRTAVLFRRGREPEELAAGTDLAPVLGDHPARFDVRANGGAPPTTTT